MADKVDVDSLAKAFESGSKSVESKLGKNPERKKEFLNTSGIPVDRLYTPVHTKDLNYLADLGFPGSYPFTRGVAAHHVQGSALDHAAVRRVWKRTCWLGFCARGSIRYNARPSFKPSTSRSEYGEDPNSAPP